MYDFNLQDFGVIGAEVYSSSTNGAVAFSYVQAIDTAAKLPIYNLPIPSTVQAVDRLDQNLWYFNSVSNNIGSVPMVLIKAPSIVQQPGTNIVVVAGNSWTSRSGPPVLAPWATSGILITLPLPVRPIMGSRMPTPNISSQALILKLSAMRSAWLRAPLPR